MKRTQMYLTAAQDRRLGQIALKRGISKARALSWAVDSALGTGHLPAAERAVILSTAGVCADYPDWPEWQRQIRGRAAGHLAELP